MVSLAQGSILRSLHGWNQLGELNVPPLSSLVSLFVRPPGQINGTFLSTTIIRYLRRGNASLRVSLTLAYHLPATSCLCDSVEPTWLDP